MISGVRPHLSRVAACYTLKVQSRRESQNEFGFLLFPDSKFPKVTCLIQDVPIQLVTCTLRPFAYDLQCAASLS
ncbi:hypothetical protein L3X38_000343 [Prunus dulcis]|uniref:Uncharacterized protein n=1 Tax=Prunus dulcis TaxID=3755 RepID=A0AAD4YJ55_PRUDU|nr:hypothetical protein L3X38_000343 [Prunus dulcis]